MGILIYNLIKQIYRNGIEKDHLSTELEKAKMEISNLKNQHSMIETSLKSEYQSIINDLRIKSDNLSKVFCLFI